MLGFVCALFAILPVVGTPLVWLPVAGGLFIVPPDVLEARAVAAGSGLLLAMFGGALGRGAAGLILAALILRPAKEAVDAWREDVQAAPAAPD